MRVAVFSTKRYDRESLTEAAQACSGHELVFMEPRLSLQTAGLAEGFEGVCAFVNDEMDGSVLARLASGGTKLIALRSAGFNHVDLAEAARLGLTVVRVPAYSPYAVAEHAVGLMLALNRKFHKAYARVREGNFSLEGLLGFDLHGRVVGIVGTGKIGEVVARVLHGFGCRLLAYDLMRNATIEAVVEYVSLEDLLRGSDIISLHCPLVPPTYHLICDATLALVKPDVMLINTSRGALIDAQAVVRALKSGRIGYLGLDVYEEEADLFFEDLSGQVIQDDVFSRLLTFPNVLITGHQAFFTRNALSSIARQTLENITAFERGLPLANQVTMAKVKTKA